MNPAELERLIAEIQRLPEDAATSSRDFGRGYAQAVRDVEQILRAAAARPVGRRSLAPIGDRAPRLLDLCCGGGGASMGYHRAGFEVVGVDIAPMPRYPFEFHQADAIEFLLEHGREFDIVHASPPCQPYTRMSKCREGLAGEYDDTIIAAIRDICRDLEIPFIIENAVGAPLFDPIELCGHMFGLQLYRHRWFETSVPIAAPPHKPHTLPTSAAGRWKPGTIMTVAGHCAPISVAKDAMGIGWMTRDELAEAIPPAYTEYLGGRLMAMRERTAA